MSRQRILLLAYYAPPVQVTGNIRRYHLCLELQKQFEAVHIITSSNAKRMKHDPSLRLPGIPLIFIPTIDVRRLTLKRQQRQGPTLPHALKKRKVFKLFRRIADSFPFNIFLDDGGPVYIWKAYKRAKRLIQQEEITHLFSSFRPQADHTIAYLLKRKFPKLTWIADFRDLAVDPIRQNVISPNFQHRWHCFFLGKANIVTTVSQGLAKHLQRYHAQVYVLPNAIPNIPINKSPLSLFQKCFTISYTGSLYPELQDLNLLFSCLRSLQSEGHLNPDNFQLIYAGKDGVLWDTYIESYQLQAFNNNKGLINYNEAFVIQQRSHLNLLLSWSSSKITGVMTAKQGSYLAARRPILALIKGKIDLEFEKQLEYLQAGKIFYTTDTMVMERLKDYLQESLLSWKQADRIPSKMFVKELESMQWEEQVRRFYRLLNDISYQGRYMQQEAKKGNKTDDIRNN